MSEQIAVVARRARVAANQLALASRAVKDAALEAMAQALLDNTTTILAANAEDVAAAAASGTPEHKIGRAHV